MLTDVGGSLAVPVLSTPSMIGVMERNAARLARAHLADGKATVGFEVCVRHVASALQGASCRVSASLREVIDGRNCASRWRCTKASARSDWERTSGG